MTESTRYASHECNENDPRAIQPHSIKIPMKPHQLTALFKMMTMEKTNRLVYDVSQARRYDLQTTVGVLADKVGYGKSLCVLALIASSHVFNTSSEIIVTSKSNSNNQNIILKTNNSEVQQNDARYIKATLLVAPHGPVMAQWEDSVRKQTNLKVLSLTKKKQLEVLPQYQVDNQSEVRTFLNQYDIIIVSGTFYRQFRDYYGARDHLEYWNRCVVDEAHSLRTNQAMRPVNTRFSWFVTATPYDLRYPSSSGYVRQSFSCVTDELLQYIMVKNKDAYLTQSFNLPGYHSFKYLCKEVVNMGFVSMYASPHIRSLLNASDFEGAVSALGGKVGVDSDIIELITKDVKRDIENKKIELDMTARLDLPELAKRTRLQKLTNELKSLEEKNAAVTERLSDLVNKDCAICCSTFDNPISLGCTHVFCAACIFKWMEMRWPPSCPTCKTPVNRTNMFFIGDKKTVDQAESSSAPSIPTLNKVETVLKIIEGKPDGRFIIFSQHYGSFDQVTTALNRKGIHNRILAGQGSSQIATIQAFKHGAVRALMLNSWHSGAGIDLHMASDIILFSKLEAGTETQVIGRGQRPGRVSPLRVHYLYHKNEIDPEEDTSGMIISN